MRGRAVNPRLYYVVFGALVLLTGTTVGVYYLPLGELHSAAALIIAAVKAALVLLFFMHLVESTRLTWVVALSGLVWLAILFALTLSDYGTREWMNVPGH